MYRHTPYRLNLNVEVCRNETAVPDTNDVRKNFKTCRGARRNRCQNWPENVKETYPEWSTEISFSLKVGLGADDLIFSRCTRPRMESTSVELNVKTRVGVGIRTLGVGLNCRLN